MLLEVGEERIVSEVLEPGGVVCHDVLRSWEVEGLVAISMIPLVKAGEAAQV